MWIAFHRKSRRRSLSFWVAGRDRFLKTTKRLTKAHRPDIKFTYLTVYQRKMQIFIRKWTIWDKLMEDGMNNIETYRQQYHHHIGAGPSLFPDPAHRSPDHKHVCLSLWFGFWFIGYIWLVFCTTAHFPPLTHRWRCTKLSVHVFNPVCSFFFLFSAGFFFFSHSSRVAFLLVVLSGSCSSHS